MRIAAGLEGCAVDSSVVTITALDETDHRVYDVRVADTAVLLVAKIHRSTNASAPRTPQNKDAHDIPIAS